MSGEKQPTIIYLARHGQTWFNTMGRVQGWSDTPLTPEGIEVVDAVCAAAEPTDNNGTIPAEKQPVMTSVTIRTEPAE